MKALAAIVAVQFALRLSFQAPFEALASTAFLLVFVTVCYHLGGWRSLSSAKQWLAARPFCAWLIATGVVGVVALALFSSHFSAISVMAEAIGAYFVFHAFCALGDWITGRFKRS